MCGRTGEENVSGGKGRKEERSTEYGVEGYSGLQARKTMRSAIKKFNESSTVFKGDGKIGVKSKKSSLKKENQKAETSLCFGRRIPVVECGCVADELEQLGQC